MTAHNRNMLYQLARARGLNLSAIQAHLSISQPTCTLYIREPLRMDGHTRHKLAELFKLDISVLDRVINDDFLELEAVFEANNLSMSQRVTSKTKI